MKSKYTQGMVVLISMAVMLAAVLVKVTLDTNTPVQSYTQR